MKNRSSIGLTALIVAVGLTCFTIIKSRQAIIMNMVESQSLMAVVEATMGSTEFGYAVMDEHGKVRLWNNAMEVMTGYTKSEMLNRDYKELPMIPDREQNKHAHGYKDAMSDPSKVGKSITIYCKMKPKTGDEFPIRIVARIFQTSDGRKYSTANIEKVSDLQVIDKGITQQIPAIEQKMIRQ